MILLLGNFAGVFSNLIKILTWATCLSDSDTILFFYANKGGENNNNSNILPFQDIKKELHRNIFYKIFKLPEGFTEESLLETDRFEMGYPQGIKSEDLPLIFRNYSNAFIACNMNVYNDTNFPEMRHYYNKLIKKYLCFTDYYEEEISSELSYIRELRSSGKKILAVFIRFTGHFNNYNYQSIFNEISEKMKDYDYILPITQVIPFLNPLCEEFNDRCIIFPRRRVNADADWIANFTDDEFYSEFHYAVSDVYLASQCDYIMGGSSNMLLGALFFNPDVPFSIFNELKDKPGG